MIAEDFWNFLGSGDIFNDLLGCFDRAGRHLKPQIDHHFTRFKNERL